MIDPNIDYEISKALELIPWNNRIKKIANSRSNLKPDELDSLMEDFNDEVDDEN